MEKNFNNLELIISFRKFFKSSSCSFILFFNSFTMIDGYLPVVPQMAGTRKRKSGQSVLEYFLLFTVIIAFTVIGISAFFPRIQASFNSVQNAAIERIINAN